MHAPFAPVPQQGKLFTSLPQQINRFKSELEEDFLPPRERAMLERQYALLSTLG